MGARDDADDIRDAIRLKGEVEQALRTGAQRAEANHAEPYGLLATRLNSYSESVWPSDARKFADEILARTDLDAEARRTVQEFRDGLDRPAGAKPGNGRVVAFDPAASAARNQK